jgi:hypothetical protein
MPLSSCLKTFAFAAAILARPTTAAPAESVTTRSQIDAGIKPWPAPTGHRQPHVPGVNLSADLLELETDRKLRICRCC